MSFQIYLWLPQLVISGISSASDNKPVYLRGLSSLTSTQLLYLRGSYSSANSQGVYLAGISTASSNQSIFSRGRDESVNSQPVYLRGVNYSSDNQPVYLKGLDSLTDTQNLYLKSSESIADSQPVYFQSASDIYLSQSVFLRGRVDNFVNNQSIYLKASNSATDFTSIYIRGKDTSIDNQAIYIRGLSESSDSQPIYLISLSGHSDNQAVYLRGSSEHSDNKPIYLRGLLEYSDNQPVYLRGLLEYSDNQPVYLAGLSGHSGFQLVYLRGSSEYSDSQSIFILAVPLTSNQKIYLKGSVTFQDNQSIFIACSANAINNLSIYLEGSGIETSFSDNQSVYIRSQDYLIDNQPVYIRSQSVSIDTQPLFFRSSELLLNYQEVYLRSFDIFADNQPIYLAGQIIFTDNQPVYLACQTTFTNGLAIFLKGSDFSVNNINIYLRSSSTETDNQPVYLVGNISSTKQQAIFLRGSELSIDWYVDEINGNDTNDGKSPATPFKTIAKLLTVFSENQAVALKRGCMWRERLVIPNSCMVTSYGEGDKPILNALDVIPKASWSKTEGYTNVYQCLITPEWGGSKNWLNVYENELYLTRQTSIANVDANPGSMYPSAGTGTITLYIHTKNSDNPATNDKIYEYTHRLNGLDGYNAQNCIIRDIHTKGNLNEDGSLRVGPYSSVVDCKASLGSKHNVYIRRGTTIDGLETRDAYYNFVQTSHVVCNDDSPKGETIVMKNISMYMANAQWGMHGISCHRNVSGNFGTMYLKNITGQNMFSVISNFIAHTGDITIENVTSIDTTFVIHTLPGGKNVYIDGVTAVGSSSRVLDIGAANVTAKNLDVNLACNNSLLIYSTGAGTLNLSNSILRGTSFTGQNRIFYLTNSGLKITLNNNIYGSGFFSTYYITPLPTSLTSNNNCFDTENSGFNLGGIVYNTVTAWKGGTGQDTESVVGNCWAAKIKTLQVYLQSKLVSEIPTIFGKFSTNKYIKGISKPTSSLKGQSDSIITISGKIQ